MHAWACPVFPAKCGAAKRNTCQKKGNFQGIMARNTAELAPCSPYLFAHPSLSTHRLKKCCSNSPHNNIADPSALVTSARGFWDSLPFQSWSFGHFFTFSEGWFPAWSLRKLVFLAVLFSRWQGIRSFFSMNVTSDPDWAPEYWPTNLSVIRVYTFKFHIEFFKI